MASSCVHHVARNGAEPSIFGAPLLPAAAGPEAPPHLQSATQQSHQPTDARWPGSSPCVPQLDQKWFLTPKPSVSALDQFYIMKNVSWAVVGTAFAVRKQRGFGCWDLCRTPVFAYHLLLVSGLEQCIQLPLPTSAQHRTVLICNLFSVAIPLPAVQLLPLPLPGLQPHPVLRPALHRV